MSKNQVIHWADTVNKTVTNLLDILYSYTKYCPQLSIIFPIFCCLIMLSQSSQLYQVIPASSFNDPENVRLAFYFLHWTHLYSRWLVLYSVAWSLLWEAGVSCSSHWSHQFCKYKTLSIFDLVTHFAEFIVIFVFYKNELYFIGH